MCVSASHEEVTSDRENNYEVKDRPFYAHDLLLLDQTHQMQGDEMNDAKWASLDAQYPTETTTYSYSYGQNQHYYPTEQYESQTCKLEPSPLTVMIPDGEEVTPPEHSQRIAYNLYLSQQPAPVEVPIATSSGKKRETQFCSVCLRIRRHKGVFLDGHGASGRCPIKQRRATPAEKRELRRIRQRMRRAASKQHGHKETLVDSLPGW